MTRVALRALSHRYPGAAAPVPEGLSLDIPSGGLTALLGPSGCGKTTVLKLIAGLLAPSGGDIAFDGRSVLGLKPEARGVVMVFQSALLFPFMSVAENVGFGLRMRKVAQAEIAARVAAMLDLVRLPDLGHRRPAELSGGQQQRVALARALVVQPQVLLLDEPLSSLDAHLRLEMRDLIRQVQRQTGITTIVVTHDQEEAVVLADRVALLLDGRLRQYDVPDAFYRRPADRAVAEFFGGRNFLPGTGQGGRFACALGTLEVPPDRRTGPGTLTFRPEAVRLGPGPANTLQAVVDERLFLGTRTRLRLRVGAVALDAVALPDAVAGLGPGDPLTLHLPPESLWVMP